MVAFVFVIVCFSFPLLPAPQWGCASYLWHFLCIFIFFVYLDVVAILEAYSQTFFSKCKNSGARGLYNQSESLYIYSTLPAGAHSSGERIRPIWASCFFVFFFVVFFFWFAPFIWNHVLQVLLSPWKGGSTAFSFFFFFFFFLLKTIFVNKWNKIKIYKDSWEYVLYHRHIYQKQFIGLICKRIIYSTKSRDLTGLNLLMDRRNHLLFSETTFDLLPEDSDTNKR